MSDQGARHAEFKPQGTKNATRKREEMNLSIRKNKRKGKLARHRNVVFSDGIDYLARIKKFNPNALLQPTSPQDGAQQLHQLRQLLGMVTEDELDRYSHLLLDDRRTGKPAVIDLLVRLASDQTRLDTADTSLHCLVNITSVGKTNEVLYTRHIFGAGFIQDVAAPYMAAFTRTDGRTAITAEMMDNICRVIINCAFACPEAKLMVIESELFVDRAEFMHYCSWLLGAKGMPVEHILSAQLVVGAIFMDYPWSTAPTPWAFIQRIWPLQMQLFFNVLQPRPYKRQSASMQTLAASTIAVIHAVVTHLDEHHGVTLIATSGYAKFMYQLGALFHHYTRADKERMAGIFIKLSHWTMVDPGDMLQVYRDARIIPLMMQLVTHTDETLRVAGYTWAGNVMSDGIAFVQDLIMAGFIQTLDRVMRHDALSVKAQAIFAFMSMFFTCREQQRSSMGSDGAAANELMRALLVGHRLLEHVCPYLGGEGLDKLSEDILILIEMALEWDWNLCMEHLERTNGRAQLDTLLDRIQHIKGNGGESLYNAAVRVDDLIHGRDPDDSTMMMEWSGGDGPVLTQDGVYQGAFTF